MPKGGFVWVKNKEFLWCYPDSMRSKTEIVHVIRHSYISIVDVQLIKQLYFFIYCASTPPSLYRKYEVYEHYIQS